ncbi:MAG: CpaD family pilus assembly protein [Ancalomicrobiaceae bacterium]|nr:CpaD family pilus assembly protein [Ancalomicrobiaceae bacterium]
MRISHGLAGIAAAPAAGFGRSPVGRRLTLLAAVAASALALAGCANNFKTEPTVTGSLLNDGYRTRHPIVLTESAETLDVPVGSQSGVLTVRMAHTITLFAADSRRRGATRVTILMPSGSANQAAAYRMSAQIVTALASGGIPKTAISRVPYQVSATAADAPIRIAYPRVKAMLTHPCGRWPDLVATDKFDNQDDFEFGCSTQANIAAMAADPTDLVTPAGMDPADGTRRATVIGKYERGEQTKANDGAKIQAIADSVTGGN